MAGHFRGPLKGSRGVYEVKSLRFLGADAAVVLTKAGIVAPEPPSRSEPMAELLDQRQARTATLEAFADTIVFGEKAHAGRPVGGGRRDRYRAVAAGAAGAAWQQPLIDIVRVAHQELLVLTTAGLRDG